MVGLAMAGNASQIISRARYSDAYTAQKSAAHTLLAVVLISGPLCCPSRKMLLSLHGSLAGLTYLDKWPSLLESGTYDCVISMPVFNLPSNPSFACANFISTLATFNTGFEPSARVTIGIYAAVLIAQGKLYIPAQG